MNDFRLDAKNLTVSVGAFGKTNILDNITLSFFSGELIGVLGPSGSGKSTLLNAICGFRKSDKGEIFINNIDLYKNFDKFRTYIGYVPQDDIIHKELSIYKTLKYSALLRLPPETKKEIIESKIVNILNMLELEDKKHIKVKKLSGGQRKRVSIGVELLTSPGIMFLDEPTSGLDPALEKRMMGILRNLADENRLIFVSTHIMKSLDSLDLIILMYRGKLAFVGNPSEIRTYFEVEDISEIFQILTKKSPDEWNRKIITSNLYSSYVIKRISMPFPSDSINANEKNENIETTNKINNVISESIEAELERLKKELGQ